MAIGLLNQLGGLGMYCQLHNMPNCGCMMQQASPNQLHNMYNDMIRMSSLSSGRISQAQFSGIENKPEQNKPNKLLLLLR